MRDASHYQRLSHYSPSLRFLMILNDVLLLQNVSNRSSCIQHSRMAYITHDKTTYIISMSWRGICTWNWNVAWWAISHWQRRRFEKRLESLLSNVHGILGRIRRWSHPIHEIKLHLALIINKWRHQRLHGGVLVTNSSSTLCTVRGTKLNGSGDPFSRLNDEEQEWADWTKTVDALRANASLCVFWTAMKISAVYISSRNSLCATFFQQLPNFRGAKQSFFCGIVLGHDVGSLKHIKIPSFFYISARRSNLHQ